MIYVLLTDSDDGTALVACPDEAAADQVAAAAVYSGGDVSAWLVPTMAIPEWGKVAELLREDRPTNDLHEHDELTYVEVARV